MAIDPVQGALVISPESRNAVLQRLDLIKVATIIASITVIFFFAIHPTIFSFLLACSALLMRDTHAFAQNAAEIVNSPQLLDRVEQSSQALLNQLGKETFFLGTLLNTLSPQITFQNITAYLRGG